VPFLRFSRDKRGYEHIYLVHDKTRRGKPSRPRVLYWYRTPPGVRVGRAPFDDDVRKRLETQNPDIQFDWPAIVSARMPPPAENEQWRERRRAERAARQAQRAEEVAEREAESAPAQENSAAANVEMSIDIGVDGDNGVLADEPLPPMLEAVPEHAVPETSPAGLAPDQTRRRRRRGGRRRRGRQNLPASNQASMPEAQPGDEISSEPLDNTDSTKSFESNDEEPR
jgi:hypothetical protein